jgi:hypothetical protein
MTRMKWKKAKKYNGYLSSNNSPEDSRARQAAYTEKQWLKKQLREVESRLKQIEGNQSKNTSRELFGYGEPCPKCGKLMNRYQHGKGWVPRPNSYYFKYWDICAWGCRHTQHYECAKIFVNEIKQSHPNDKVMWRDTWED